MAWSNIKRCKQVKIRRADVGVEETNAITQPEGMK